MGKRQWANGNGQTAMGKRQWIDKLLLTFCFKEKLIFIQKPIF
jgi:hypothetical protein